VADRTFAVVGANLAGGRAVEALRKEGFDGRIVLFGEEPHRPYERPPLSKEVLRGEHEESKAFLRDESWYADNQVELELGTRVTQIDPAERAVMAGGRLVGYDALLLCTGGRPRRLAVQGADLDGIFTLRTMDDARAIGERLGDGVKVAVVGMGFIGAEVAASARTLGCDVTVFEVFETPLERVLGSEIGATVAGLHRDNGVRLEMQATAERFEGDGGVRRVVLADGRTFDADVVIMGVGIEPADELAREAGIACDNGIVVDERCQTSAPGVYAAGDVANHPNPILGHRLRIEHWQNAQKQAAAAARAMLGGTEPFADLPWFWSDQFDVNIQMYGHTTAWDEIVFRGDVEGRNFAAYYLSDGAIAQAFACNRARDARAVRPLIEKRAKVDPAVLADEGTDLRALAKQA
jgi:3-phenylpropionate/trans-cinnamate dioxygenase ferredoxin reductase subunit